jgi:hypothetical protein
MPIHDWTTAPSGFFHHFQQFWSGAICDALNDGRMPAGYYALVELHMIGLVPDILTLQQRSKPRPSGPADGSDRGGGIAAAEAPPKVRYVSRVENALYVAKANRVVVRNAGGQVVAVVEIVSPGNKQTAHAVGSFVQKAGELLRADVNLLVIDLFPPTPRDPQGLHPLIWAEVQDEPFELPADEPLTLAAYAAGPPTTAYVEPVAVGRPLPDMPAFLDADTYVPAPLGPTYEETWARCPREFREAVLAAGAADRRLRLTRAFVVGRRQRKARADGGARRARHGPFTVRATRLRRHTRRPSCRSPD